MSLREYKRKRNFRRTPEPEPKVAKGAGLSYVIQKHAASHLHYDFRLGMHGVLKSWSVPKGPPFKEGERRLAMATEDHPVEYLKFEGYIPEGNYGAGEDLIWDSGTYELERDDRPLKQLKKGKLNFHLHGEKLHGVSPGRSRRGPRRWCASRRP